MIRRFVSIIINFKTTFNLHFHTTLKSTCKNCHNPSIWFEWVVYPVGKAFPLPLPLPVVPLPLPLPVIPLPLPLPVIDTINRAQAVYLAGTAVPSPWSKDVSCPRSSSFICNQTFLYSPQASFMCLWCLTTWNLKIIKNTLGFVWDLFVH